MGLLEDLQLVVDELGHDYWEDGYTEESVNEGCELLTGIVNKQDLPGQVVVVWDFCDMWGFGGDSSLYYVQSVKRNGGLGYDFWELDIPFRKEADLRHRHFVDGIMAVKVGVPPDFKRAASKISEEGYNVTDRYCPTKELD